MKTQPINKNFVRELTMSYGAKSLTECNKVMSSEDACTILRDIWTTDISNREAFYVLCLNRSNKVLGYALISIGGLSGTVVDPKVIFSIALLANASNIILAHNHPSGNNEPSEADKSQTRKLVSAGKLLDIEVFDHIILTPDDFYSFADQNQLN